MIEQRSKEWFEQRKNRITGSAIGAILGVSPFTKPKDVMRRMVRDANGYESEFVGNIATDFGTANEPVAILDFMLETGLQVTETGFHVHPEHAWLGASPDGLVGDDAVIEIKCPYGKRNSSEFVSINEQLHYMAQIQYEMFCTGRKKCYFFQWSPKGTMLEVVEFQQSFIDGTLPRLKEFYDKFQLELKNPEKHLSPLVKTIDACKASIRYEEALKTFNDAKSELEEAKEELVKLANGNKTVIGDLLVYPIEKQGSISYSKVVKELLPDADLEKYRGKPSLSWGVR